MRCSGIATAPLIQAADRKGAVRNHEACDDKEISKVTSDFFSAGAKGLSDVLAKVLKEKRRPFAYIRGEEFGGVFDQICSP